MKVLIGAAAAALLIAASGEARAQAAPTSPMVGAEIVPSHCGELPAQPSLPDGAVANSEAMTAGQAALVAWDASYRANLTCRRIEFEELLALSQTRRDAHNAGAEVLNAALAVWAVEIAEYNTLHPPRRRGR